MSTPRLRIATVVAILALFAVVVPSVAASPVPSERIVTESTVLTEDHIGWIRIWGEGAVLDCAGHAVIGDGSMHGIYVSADNVTVRNCAISGALSGVVMFGNWEEGVLHGWDGLVLENNRAFENSVNGFAVYFGSDITAVHNKAFMNAEEGFKIRSVTQSVFIDNKAHKNGWSGFYITEESIDSTFDSNLATKNGVGFKVEAPAVANLFIDNVCNRNIDDDFTQDGVCS